MKLNVNIYNGFWERGWTVVEHVFAAEEMDRRQCQSEFMW